jgi:hemoglobin
MEASHAPSVDGRPVAQAVDEASIERLVRHFYARIQGDAELAPIFAAVIPGDWEPHLHTMIDFWSSVMLRTGRFNGRPVSTHRALVGVTPKHFDTWLRLFDASARAIYPAAVAEQFVDRAGRIADSLQRAMFPPAGPGPAKHVIGDGS